MAATHIAIGTMKVAQIAEPGGESEVVERQVPESAATRYPTGVSMPEQRKCRLGITGRLGVLWCRLMHDSTMWPIHGSYRCRTCARNYAVPWADLGLDNPTLVPGSPATVLLQNRSIL